MTCMTRDGGSEEFVHAKRRIMGWWEIRTDSEGSTASPRSPIY
jgi:hypothetical protein